MSQIYCHHSQICSDRCKRKQGSNLHPGLLVDHLVQAIKISGVGPMQILQQHKTQSAYPTKLIYMQGKWLSSFVCAIFTAGKSFDHAFRSFEVCIRPAALLLGQVPAGKLDFTFMSCWPDLDHSAGKRRLLQ